MSKQEQPNPDKVPLLLNRGARLSMLGDLKARNLSKPSKLKWFLVLLFMPFGTAYYYHGVYSKAPGSDYNHQTMETAKNANITYNNLLFYYLLGILIVISLIGAGFGLYLLLKVS